MRLFRLKTTAFFTELWTEAAGCAIKTDP